VQHLIDAALDANPTIDITTTGRRSGLPRRIEIWMFRIDDRYVITGTPGRRDWVANLGADPRLTVHIPNCGVTLDVGGAAVPITDTAFRRRVFEAPHISWYVSQAELDDLVADAPMVEVVFD
jgi:deazaflavin-dependent oxidoreductase (nitroreductase family)